MTVSGELITNAHLYYYALTTMHQIYCLFLCQIRNTLLQLGRIVNFTVWKNYYNLPETVIRFQQDPTNKRFTICDDQLEKIIGKVYCLSFILVSKL